MKQLICIVCPKGCHLQVDTENGNKVFGNNCSRGAIYGYEEVTLPKRVVTSTVKVVNGTVSRLPVKTSKSIPKEKMFQCMDIIRSLEIIPPVKRGQVILKNILETEADLIACKDII